MHLLDLRIAAHMAGGLVGKILVSGTGNEFRVTSDNPDVDYVDVECTVNVYPVTGLTVGSTNRFYNDALLTLKE